MGTPQPSHRLLILAAVPTGPGEYASTWRCACTAAGLASAATESAAKRHARQAHAAHVVAAREPAA